MWCTRLVRYRKKLKTMKKKASSTTKAADPILTEEVITPQPETPFDGPDPAVAPKAPKKASAKATKAPAKKAAKVTQPAKAKAPKAAKPAKEAKPARTPKATKKAKSSDADAGTSKKDQVLALIARKDGASLEEIMTATGWQKHTVRGFIAILGKKGTKIESFKSDAGARTYRAA